jgi:hypothetical protein
MTQLQWNDPTAMINAATDASVQAVADDLQGNVVAKYSEKEHDYWSDTPAAHGEPPAMISGHLAASVQQKTIPGGREVFTDAIYARVHELGLTIHATSKLLTVPIGAAGKRFLVAAANGGWDYAKRTYKAWLVPGRKASTPWVVRNANGPLVALKTEVKMPDRPAWQPAIEQTTKDAPAIIKAAWKKVMP